MIAVKAARLGFVAMWACAGALAAHNAAMAQGAAGPPVKLAPHVAIYDLKLTSSRGKRALESVRGRIVYDFSGSSCEGYALQFRQVTELDSGEGKVALSDLRTRPGRRGAAELPLKSQTTWTEQIGESTGSRSGRAPSREADQPEKSSIRTVVFPTDTCFSDRARSRQTLLEIAY